MNQGDAREERSLLTHYNREFNKLMCSIRKAIIMPNVYAPVVLFLLGWIAVAAGQDAAKQPSPWQTQVHSSGASFRGLYVVDDKVAWASGSGGTVLRTLDGGLSWKTVSPPETQALDFRDVHAFDDSRAVIISAGTPARVYSTVDGGLSWRLSYEDPRPEAFFDAMSFWDSRRGIAFSDPIEGRLLLIESDDGGTSWRELDRAKQPVTLPNEAGFAASGTCLCVVDELLWIGLGGARSDDQPAGARVLRSTDRGETWSAFVTPIQSGQTSGIFSMAFANRDHGVAVGGTYDDPTRATSNVCITDDGGNNWREPTGTRPRGYRSGVAVRYVDDASHFVTVGITGSEISTDWGNSWQPLGEEPFHAVAFSKDGKTGLAVGGEGRLGVWTGRR